MNTRGARDLVKRKDLLNYLANIDSNIICLQDTHWLTEDFKDIYQTWNNPCQIHGTKTNSRGVAILFKSDFEFKVENTYTDDIGNLQTTDILINNDITLKIINIYGPNSDSPEFYNNINEIFINNTCDYVILCGDFNLILDPIMDSYKYQNINNPKARIELLKMIKSHNLSDVYRSFNPNTKRYTWRKQNPIKQARLDFFLISPELTDIVSEATITSGYKTDHSMVNISLKLNNFKKGNGTWKFNCSLLANCDYVKLINKTIDQEKIKYLPPVYNMDNIHTISDNEIQFTIPDNLFLETLMMEIRGISIKFSSRIKKNSDQTEKNLVTEINNIENSFDLESNYEILEQKKIELQKIREKKLRGEIIRSRVQILNESERPTKYFCALENKNYVNKTIKKINKGNNVVITEQNEIMSEICKFYKSLFSNKDHLIEDIDLNTILTDKNIRKLSETESKSIEQPITLAELSLALKNMKNNKSPGLDGFPADFYKFFWIKLKYFVYRSINLCLNMGELSTTMRQCVITCLPKGEKPREYLKNWRPISLLNVSYKLISAAVANRLKSILNPIISNTQTGFLAGQSITETTRLIYDIMSHCEVNKVDGLLMLIDFEKAFDSVSWAFLYKVLTFFNFETNIQNIIKTLNKNITSSITQCGYLSEFFPIGRGCRQGEPIARICSSFVPSFSI